MTGETDPNTDESGELIGKESSLSGWVGPYATDMLGDAAALADLPYEAYSDPLIAGTTDLQTNAFGTAPGADGTGGTGIAGLTMPGGFGEASTAISGVTGAGGYGALPDYTATDFTTGKFTDEGIASSYMNPYIQEALNPQLAELRRQSQIDRMNDRGRYTRAGAFGGSRGTISESELTDNMLRLMAETTGQGYSDAYNAAQTAFTDDQDRALQADRYSDQSNQFGATYGLDALAGQRQAAEAQARIAESQLNSERNIYSDQLEAGGIQRGIAQEGLDSDYQQWQEERDHPFQMVNWRHSLLDGLPLAAQNYDYSDPDFISSLGSSIGGILKILKDLEIT